MSQKLKDAVSLLQTSRKHQVGAIMIVLVLGFLFFDGGSNRGRYMPPPAAPVPIGAGRADTDEAYRDLVTRFDQNLTNLEKKVDDIQQQTQIRQQEEEEFKTQISGIFRKLIEQVNMMEASQGQAGGMAAGGLAPAPYDISGGADPTLDASSGSVDIGGGQFASLDLDAFGEAGEVAVAPPPPPPSQKTATISAGDTVRVKLLSGVNAPTDGTPYPVVLQLDGDILGPDGSVLPLGEARLIAAAQGSLTDSRALFRLSDLSIRFPNGRRKVVKVDGWVVGEDGRAGLPGILIDPIGKSIGAAMMTGAIEGLGQGIAEGQQTVRRDGIFGNEQIIVDNVGKYAAGRGLQNGSNQWGQIVRERAQQLVPHIEVRSGRTATAVFSRSFTIDGLIEALEENEGAAGSLD